MRKTIFTLFLSLALVSLAAADEFTSRAKVIETLPVVETVYETEETCRYKLVKRTSQRISDNTGEKLAGGLVGGIAGSAVGKGSGRDASAAIGAIIGSEIGDGDGITEGELVGGIVGGLLGNQVGKGKGKTAATATGALLGAIVGDNIQNGNQHNTQNKKYKKVRICSLTEVPKKAITGYKVFYKYGGIEHVAVLARRP